jgi:hypothetical protein
VNLFLLFELGYCSAISRAVTVLVITLTQDLGFLEYLTTKLEADLHMLIIYRYCSRT